MIPQYKRLNYFVYLPHSTIAWKWEELDAVFKDPFGRGMLSTPYPAGPDYFSKLGFVPALDTYKLIAGPVGNGIIQYRTPEDNSPPRYLWMRPLSVGHNHAGGANFPGPHGLEKYDSKQLGVNYFEEMHSGEVQFGLRVRKVVHPPRFTHITKTMAEPAVLVGIAVVQSKRSPCAKPVEQMMVSCLGHFGIHCEAEQPPEWSTLTGIFQRDPKPLDQVWLRIAQPLDDIRFVLATLLYATCVDLKLLKKIRGIHFVTRELLRT